MHRAMSKIKREVHCNPLGCSKDVFENADVLRTVTSMSLDSTLMNPMGGGEDGIARIKDFGGVHVSTLARRSRCDVFGGNH